MKKNRIKRQIRITHKTRMARNGHEREELSSTQQQDRAPSLTMIAGALVHFPRIP